MEGPHHPRVRSGRAEVLGFFGGSPLCVVARALGCSGGQDRLSVGVRLVAAELVIRRVTVDIPSQTALERPRHIGHLGASS